MQRLSLMRIMKRQRMKYEEFESIYPVTIYHKTIPWIYNSCHFLSFRDRIVEMISAFLIMGVHQMEEQKIKEGLSIWLECKK